jgi:hypothetical protein
LAEDDLWRDAAFKPDVNDKKLPLIQITTNRRVVDDPDTAVSLAATDVFTRGFLKIKAERKNKNLVYIGNGNSTDLRNNGYPLDAGEEIELPVNNLKLVFFQGETAGDAIRLIFGK